MAKKKKAKAKKAKKVLVKKVKKVKKAAPKKSPKKVVKKKAIKAAKPVAKKAVIKPEAKKAASKPEQGKAVSKSEPKKAAAKPEIKKVVKDTKLKKGLHTVYLGLGSNVGDREEYLEQAIFLLSKTPGIKIIKKSSSNDTEPEGGPDQPQFLNSAVAIQTAMDPYKLLSVLQETESALGREREVDWGPRTIDLDILLFDDLILSDDKLQIPHPLLHERVFVLKPLAEIAPNVIHPVLEKTIEEMYEERKNELGEKYDDDLPGFKKIKEGTPDDYERW